MGLWPILCGRLVWSVHADMPVSFPSLYPHLFPLSSLKFSISFRLWDGHEERRSTWAENQKNWVWVFALKCGPRQVLSPLGSSAFPSIMCRNHTKYPEGHCILTSKEVWKFRGLKGKTAKRSGNTVTSDSFPHSMDLKLPMKPRVTLNSQSSHSTSRKLGWQVYATRSSLNYFKWITACASVRNNSLWSISSALKFQ